MQNIKNIYNGKVDVNNTSLIDPLELDFVLPEVRLAIECNGSFTHSQRHKTNLYHAEKTSKTFDKGFHLIHINEFDWNMRKNQIIRVVRWVIHDVMSNSYIKNVVDYQAKTMIEADTMATIEVSAKDAIEFFDKNHHSNSFIIGDYHRGIIKMGCLVAVGSFSINKISKSLTMEDFCIGTYVAPANLIFWLAENPRFKKVKTIWLDNNFWPRNLVANSYFSKIIAAKQIGFNVKTKANQFEKYRDIDSIPNTQFANISTEIVLCSGRIKCAYSKVQAKIIDGTYQINFTTNPVKNEENVQHLIDNVKGFHNNLDNSLEINQRKLRDKVK